MDSLERDLKGAREQAMLGQYDKSVGSYDAVLGNISVIVGSQPGGEDRHRWEKCKSQIQDEVKLVRKILFDEGGTVIKSLEEIAGEGATIHFTMRGLAGLPEVIVKTRSSKQRSIVMKLIEENRRKNEAKRAAQSARNAEIIAAFEQRQGSGQ